MRTKDQRNGSWILEGEGEDEEAGAEKSPLLRILAAAAILLVLVIAAGTIWAVASGSRARALARQESKLAAGSDIFDLGQVRATSGDPKAALIAARISFPYPAGDIRFKEELDKKAPALRAAAVDFLSSKKAADLAPASEGAVKAGLIGAFNALLSLGKLEEVWLSDFAVLR
ncbi:MAG TPA: flagellar basal body-associated FliL family protein [Rectinemataceae bacterium]|nr:flagellar basal body-associated FliL family protein [Rectinemataceae bacterium]